MRALLIDPFKREIREVDGPFKSDFTVIQQFLGSGELGGRRAPFCCGPRLARNVHTWVDDEGYFRPNQAWFFFKGYNSPLAGYCLILGDDESDEADCPDFITPERIKSIVIWTDAADAAARIAPITVTSFDRDFSNPRVVSETPIDMTDIRPLVTAEERRVLRWLGEAESSLYGECKGEMVDRFMADGLAEFIDPGSDVTDWSRVRLTDLGRKTLR